jgi:hypothetical protein
MICKNKKKNRKIEDILYPFHLYFNGLSLRNIYKQLYFCIKIVKRSHNEIRGGYKSINLKNYF